MVVAIFTSYYGLDFVPPFAPLFVRELGVIDVGDVARWSALVLGITPALSALSSPFWGALGDRYGHKIVLVFLLLGLGGTLALSAVSQDVSQFFLSRAMQGIFGGLIGLSLTLITMSVPPNRLAQAVGLQQSAQIFALTVAPLTGGVLAQRFGLHFTFLVAAVLCLISSVAVGTLFRNQRGESHVVKKTARPSFRAIFRVKGLAWALAIVFLLQMLDRSFFLLLPIQAGALAHEGESVPVAVGIIFSAGGVAGAISSLMLGRLASSRRIETLLLVSLAGGAILTFAMGRAGGLTELGLARICHSLLAGGALALALTRASSSFSETSRGTAFALLGSAALAGTSLSYPLAALPMSASIQNGFLMIAALYLLAMGLVVASNCLSKPFHREALT